MALHYLESFGSYATDDHTRGWFGDGGLNYVQIRDYESYPDHATAPGKRGMYNYGAGGWATHKYFFSGEEVEEIIVGYKRNFIDGEYDMVSRNLAEFSNHKGCQFTIQLNADHSISAWRGLSINTHLARSQPGLVKNGCWQQMEFKVKIHDSTGYWYVRIDGEDVFSGEDYDTRYQASLPGIDRVGLGGGSQNSYADLYIATLSGEYNSDWIDGLRVDCLHPSGAGTNTDWTPDAGSNYDRVDDGGDVDEATYIASATDGHVDTYNFEDLEGLSGETTILGVQVKSYAKDDQISGELLPVFYDGTKYTGSGELATKNWSRNWWLADGLNYYQKMHWAWDRDPGGGEWTEATINNGEFGIELNIP